MRFITYVVLLKKVLLLSTFFIGAWVNAIASVDSACIKPDRGRESVQVKWVYDGDTVKLTDQRKLRIIGIDAPETAHQRQKAEPYAGQATEALRELLLRDEYRLFIQPGRQPKDKYGRLLAHAFTPQGVNVSQWLLQQGLATSLVIPPNTDYVDCYRQAEQQAQARQLKLWRLKPYQLQNTANLDRKFTGYVRLRGTVKRVRRRKNRISITLDHHVYITIKRPDLKLFHNLDSEHLKGRAIQVTGILYRHGKKAYIRVRHPVYLEIIE